MEAMSEPSRNQSFERVLRAGHELRRSLAKLRQLLAACRDPTAPLALLDDLHRQLEAHFRFEEAGGYLRDVLAQAPGHAVEAGRLQAQHAALLGGLDRLQAEVEGCLEAPRWASVRAAFARFREELERHERAEIHLVQESVLTDLGAED
jgi:hypothetical protein